MIAEAGQPNFNAGSSNFSAFDEHKLIRFRNNHLWSGWLGEPTSGESLASVLFFWSGVDQLNR